MPCGGLAALMPCTKEAHGCTCMVQNVSKTGIMEFVVAASYRFHLLDFVGHVRQLLLDVLYP
jgi:hypothetical protein